MDKPDKIRDMSDIGELQNIVNSSALRRVLNYRKEFHQKEVNRFVREQNLIQAYGSLCKYDDIDKFLEILQKKVNELKKEA
jgi:hypothetical protein